MNTSRLESPPRSEWLQKLAEAQLLAQSDLAEFLAALVRLEESTKSLLAASRSPISTAEPVLVDAHQAASRLGVSRRRVWELNRQGRLPSAELGGRTRRFAESDIAALLPRARPR